MDALTNRIGVRHTITADVPNNGTFVVGYPEGYGPNDFVRSPGDHWLYVAGKYWRLSQGEVGVTLGATNVTVTWKGGRVLRAGEVVVLGLERNSEYKNFFEVPGGVKVTGLYAVRINFGAPVAASTNAICLPQTRASAGDLVLNGASINSGVAMADVARAVTITSTGNLSARIFTVIGTDVRGRRIVHKITGPNNSTSVSTKTFATVERVSVNGDMSGVNCEVGFGNVFGLPVFIASPEQVWKGLVDGVASTVTINAGVMGEQTYNTADAFGRATFTTAPDGTKVFELFAFVPSIDTPAAMPKQ